MVSKNKRYAVYFLICCVRGLSASERAPEDAASLPPYEDIRGGHFPDQQRDVSAQGLSMQELFFTAHLPDGVYIRGSQAQVQALLQILTSQSSQPPVQQQPQPVVARPIAQSQSGCTPITACRYGLCATFPLAVVVESLLGCLWNSPQDGCTELCGACDADELNYWGLCCSPCLCLYSCGKNVPRNVDNRAARLVNFILNGKCPKPA